MVVFSGCALDHTAPADPCCLRRVFWPRRPWLPRESVFVFFFNAEQHAALPHLWSSEIGPSSCHPSLYRELNKASIARSLQMQFVKQPVSQMRKSSAGDWRGNYRAKLVCLQHGAAAVLRSISVTPVVVERPSKDETYDLRFSTGNTSIPLV